MAGEELGAEEGEEAVVGGEGGRGRREERVDVGGVAAAGQEEAAGQLKGDVWVGGVEGVRGAEAALGVVPALEVEGGLSVAEEGLKGVRR